MNYKRQFLTIAKKYNVPVIFTQKKYYDALIIRTINEDLDEYSFKQTIALKDIKTPKHYAIALHELGHIVNEDFEYIFNRRNKIKPRLNGTVTLHLLKEEFNAWKTAKVISPIWIKSMNDTFVFCIASYIAGWQDDWETKLNCGLLLKLVNLNTPYFKT